MDYEKKYKEALERARDLMTNQNPPAFDKDLISLIFPELKESEDEQIRKRLIRVFGSQVKEKWGGIPTADILTWLEKQGHMLDPDKVIEWLRKNTCAACWDNPDEGVSQRIDKFKKDLGL